GMAASGSSAATSARSVGVDATRVVTARRNRAAGGWNTVVARVERRLLSSAHMVTAQVLGKRPGGLTALAVVSFVIAGIAMLMSVFILLAMQMVGSVAQGFGAEHAHAAMAPMYVMFGLAAIAAVLLLVAGV